MLLGLPEATWSYWGYLGLCLETRNPGDQENLRLLGAWGYVGLRMETECSGDMDTSAAVATWGYVGLPGATWRYLCKPVGNGIRF